MPGERYNPPKREELSDELATEGSAGEIGAKRAPTARPRVPSQTPPAGVRSAEQPQEPSHQPLWQELTDAFIDQCMGLMAHEVLDITGWHPVRVPDDYVPTGDEDLLKPGLIAFVPQPDTDQPVNSGMRSIDTELELQASPRDRHTDSGDAAGA